MDTITIRSMAQRDYQMIPVEKINVVNSRNREQKQFQENVRSIGAVGLYKPILVNSRNLGSTGLYDLICGQGRLQAHIELGKTHIAADVLDVDEAQAHLMTLGENIARTADPAGRLEADFPGLSRLDHAGHAAGQLAVELVPGPLEAVGVDLVALGIQHVHGPLPLVYVQSHAIISHSKPPLVLT
jgi:ParB-like chromosome segregation protein Spo0J